MTDTVVRRRQRGTGDQVFEEAANIGLTHRATLALAIGRTISASFSTTLKIVGQLFDSSSLHGVASAGLTQRVASRIRHDACCARATSTPDEHEHAAMIRISLATVLLLSTTIHSWAVAEMDKYKITPQEHAACDGDAIAFCASTYPNEDKLIACMTVNLAQLSQTCQATFQAGMRRRHIKL